MDVLNRAVAQAAGDDAAKERRIQQEIAEALPRRRPRGKSASNEPVPATRRTVSDYLRGKRRPKLDDLELLVAAVALETGENRTKLWRLALDGVDSRVTGKDEWMQAAEVAAALRDARRREEQS